MTSGERRRFDFEIMRISPGNPRERREGIGVVVDTGTGHDGQCMGPTWCRLRVEASEDYTPGELVLCRTWDTFPA